MKLSSFGVLSVVFIGSALYCYERRDHPLVAELLSAPAQSSTVPIGCDNRGIVAAVLRNDGDGWYALQDETHSPINISGVNTTARGIELIFAGKASVIRSITVTPDEALALVGATAGASVGTHSARITLSRTGVFGQHRVSPALVTTERYPFSNLWVLGLVDMDCNQAETITAS